MFDCTVNMQSLKFLIYLAEALSLDPPSIPPISSIPWIPGSHSPQSITGTYVALNLVIPYGRGTIGPKQPGWQLYRKAVYAYTALQI